MVVTALNFGALIVSLPQETRTKISEIDPQKRRANFGEVESRFSEGEPMKKKGSLKGLWRR